MGGPEFNYHVQEIKRRGEKNIELVIPNLRSIVMEGDRVESPRSRSLQQGNKSAGTHPNQPLWLV
jgi:hypothetical protein